MKKLLSYCMMGLAALFLCPGKSQGVAGGELIYDNYLPIPNPVAYSSTFSVRADGIDWASAQIVVTSVTQSNAPTFNDGLASTATFTVNDYTSLSTAAATGQFTVISTASLGGVVASTSILISSNVAGTVVMITGPPIANLPPVLTIGGNVAAGVTSTNTAVNFAAFITTVTTSGLMTSTVSGSSVTISFVSSGTFGNAYAITSSSQAAVSSATFVGGVNAQTISIAGVTLVAGRDFALPNSTTTVASNIAAAINVEMGSNTVANVVIATNALGVVYATATVPGSAGNAFALASSSPPVISTSGPFMTGGHDNARICLNGMCLTANAVTSSFTATTSNAQTATSIAGSFSNSASSLTVNVGSAGAVVGATSTVIGPGTAYAITTSTQGALTIAPFTSSGPVGSNGVGPASGNMAGGANAGYVFNGSVITSTGSTLGLAQAVWFSTTTGNTALSPLVYGTTYYAIPGPSGSNTLQLALTSTGAVAGVSIIFTSSVTKSTSDTFMLNFPGGSGGVGAPGASVVSWAASNDNQHWVLYNLTPFNVTVGSVNYAANGYNGATGVVNNFDFGHYNYSYIGLSVTASTQAPTSVGAHIVGNAP